MKEEYILQISNTKNESENKAEEVWNKRVVLNGIVTLNKDYIFKNCDFEYGKSDSRIINNSSLTFEHCRFNCLGIQDDLFFIDSMDGSKTSFTSCDFVVCEQLLRCRANNAEVSIYDSKMRCPGERVVDILMGKGTQVILGNLEINVEENVKYDDKTIVFRIARVTQSVQPLINNVNIVAKRFVSNVKWFLCMGGEVTGGRFVNISSVFNGVNKVNNACFENCSQIINWTIPVVRKYGISNGTTSWINENIDILNSIFVNCEKNIGLGYLSKVDNCEFRECTAPMIVTSIHGGVTINKNRFVNCKLTSDQYSAFIMLSDYQDRMSKISLVSNCQVDNCKLECNQFVRLILNTNSGRKVVVRKSLKLENNKFSNSIREISNLIDDKISVGSLTYNLVEGLNSCSCEERYEKSAYDNVTAMQGKDEHRQDNNTADGGNFDEIL